MTEPEPEPSDVLLQSALTLIRSQTRDMSMAFRRSPQFKVASPHARALYE